MEHIEMVEKLRERADVSYEEAKAALEDNNWDLLDAMVQLEREGKMHYEYSSEYTTKEEAEAKQEKREEKKEKSKSAINSFFEEIKRLIKLANDRNLVISKDNKQITSIPISIVILILILTAPAFGAIVFVAIVAYFFGVRYSISKGQDYVKHAEDAQDDKDVRDQE